MVRKGVEIANQNTRTISVRLHEQEASAVGRDIWVCGSVYP